MTARPVHIGGGSGGASRRCPWGPRGRGGFTLVELVTALAISSVLFLALGNAIYIATKALPGKDDPASSSVQAAQVLDQISSEIETAVIVTAITARSIAFTVADRNADGNAERITYTWSGVAKEPLMRSYNGASWAVIDQVTTFNVVANVRHVSEEYTSPGVEDPVPSVLVDLTALLSTGVEKFGNNDRENFGQYFAPAFSPDVIGWRPTSVRVSASRDTTPGTFRVQMREASASMVPRTTVLEERLVSSGTLPAAIFLPQTYAFSTIGRQAPGNPLCLTLMWASGSGPGRFQTSKANNRMLETGSSPTDWSVASDHSLAVALYGVPMRAGSSRTATTQYLLSLGLSLASGAGPVMQTTALALNHPEVLDGLWELKFDRNPTTMDINGDGLGDWSLSPGPTFTMGQLSGGVWTTSSDTLLTEPASDFTGVTVVDLRMQATAVGATAGFAINAARSDDFCVPLSAALKLESDGTQTLTLLLRINGTTSVPVISYAQLRAQPTDVHLIIDPVAMGVAVSINGVQKGTLPITTLNRPGTPRSASIYATGGAAKFSYARVRVLRSMP